MITESFPPQLPDSIRVLYPFRLRTMHLAPVAAAANVIPTVGDENPAGPSERMSFVDEGAENALPMVLVHGNLTWSFLFRKLIAQARGRHRVIAPDLVGFGLSGKPRDAGYHTLERHAENLSQLIAELKLQKPVLVLHGMAGPIGLHYAMRFPENVSRIVLINAWVHPLATDLPGRLPFWLAAMRSRAGFLWRHWSQLPFPPLRWATAGQLETAVRLGYRWPFHEAESRVAPLAFMRLLQRNSIERQLAAMRELAPQLQKLPASVQILWGEKDPLFGSKLLPYLLRDSLPHSSEPVFVSGASHLLPEDAPELLAEKVLLHPSVSNTGMPGPPIQPQRRESQEPLFKIL